MSSTTAHQSDHVLDYTWARKEMADRGCLPETYDAIFVAGSAARGWSNALSDIDLYVIAPAPWSSETSGTSAVPVEPGTISTEILRMDGQRWEVKYWLTRQVEQVLAKVDWSSVDQDAKPQRVSLDEEFLLGRILHCAPVAGQGWIARTRERIHCSAFHLIIGAQELDSADQLVEDAVGQLQGGDLHSAVISARLAFGHAVDALLAVNGESGAPTKWRARRMRAITQDVLSFDDYWAMETMRGYDPDAPGAWIERAVALCRKISREASL